MTDPTDYARGYRDGYEARWQPIDTAPKDGTTLWLASFAPGADTPRWIAQASYGTAMPSTLQCASYSGWFVDPPLIADPSRYRGGRAEHGVIYEDDLGPTHWMRPIRAMQPDPAPAGWLKQELDSALSAISRVVRDQEEVMNYRKPDPAPAPAKFQERVQPWMMACFGPEISADKIERNHRFLEEALELVQANGCTRSEAHQLVDYVFGRPTGDLHQEIGGVMVTLAALCLAIDDDMHIAGETELARIWTKVEQIRAKQAAKPKHSPLPIAPDPAPAEGETT